MASIVQTHVIVFFWIAVAFGLTQVIRQRMKTAYDIPLQKISAVTREVAKGNFAVRVAPVHKSGKTDYLDKMADELKTMIEELGSIETLKTDFISNVSHEMKTPLAVIQNYAELLETPELSDLGRAEYTKSIKDAASKMTELITNILRLNRIENQKIVPEIRRYDVCRQLADCLLSFESRWEEKNIEPDFDFEDSAYVSADESLLELVWNNLMSNAIKFTEAGGEITVESELGKGSTFTVSLPKA